MIDFTMTIPIDHQRRRNMILERAFVLFADEGYGGVTYQKIANRCDISRTGIYKYFQNKEEIFTYAVKLATGNLNTMVEKILDRKEWTPLEKIIRILHLTVRLLEDNRVFLTVVLDYVLTQKQNGKNVKRKVRRHTFGMKFLLSRLLREATVVGELSVRNVDIAASHLYGILESYVLNLTVTEILDTKDCIELIDQYLENMKY
ncbi:MAG: TetR/AcrR family transcriptional regulator [Planctomycetaceae bacterium]|jgi:AcrR family transcriptional regulator|nr:TetR/AcrR family transcriptional regulator [Planctomycetaceae bacterium]